MKRTVVGIFLLTAALAAWAQTQKLGVGDAVRVTVFQQPDLTTEARINDRGTIAMPLGGDVHRREPEERQDPEEPAGQRLDHHAAQPAGVGARPRRTPRAHRAR